MTPKEYAREEDLINAGLQAAARVVEARAQQLKKEAPGLPIDAIRMEVRHGADASTAALWVIADWRRLAEQGKARVA